MEHWPDCVKPSRIEIATNIEIAACSFISSLFLEHLHPILSQKTKHVTYQTSPSIIFLKFCIQTSLGHKKEEQYSDNKVSFYGYNFVPIQDFLPDQNISIKAAMANETDALVSVLPGWLGNSGLYSDLPLASTERSTWTTLPWDRNQRSQTSSCVLSHLRTAWSLAERHWRRRRPIL